MLAVLGHRRSAQADRGTVPRARACGCTPTSARRSTRRSSAGNSSAAHRWSTWSRSAGWGRTSGWRTPSTCRTRRSPSWRRPAPGGALPDVQRPPRRRHRRGSGHAGRRRGGRPRRGRRRLQRGLLTAGGGPPRRCCSPVPEVARTRSPCATRWTWAPWAAPGCSAGRTRSARSRSASWPTWRCGGSTRFCAHRIADPVAALTLGALPPLELLLVNGRPIVAHDRPVTVDEDALATEVSVASRTLLARAVLGSGSRHCYAIMWAHKTRPIVASQSVAGSVRLSFVGSSVPRFPARHFFRV